MTPARLFVGEMGARLKKLSPGVQADPRVDKSIFRIFRDTRFSRDKTPYKTHLGIWFWEGDGPRMECSGFYFHLDPPKLMNGSGTPVGGTRAVITAMLSMASYANQQVTPAASRPPNASGA